jgi:hypothetical protein
MTWTHTSRGRALDLLNPVEGDVNLDEIAQALSQQCRYAGCIKRFYSVAEHSVLIAKAIDRDHPGRPDLVLAGLLHDGAEAYTGDITWPMQQVLWGASPAAREAYKAVQMRLDALICGLVGLDPALLHDPLVREYDLRILLDERAVLLEGRPAAWDVERLQPLGVPVEGWIPGRAYIEWSYAVGRARGVLAGGR